MSQYRVIKDFKGALGGCHVKAFYAGAVVEIGDADLEAVALAEGWIEFAVGEKAAAAAPKNKAAKAAPKGKTPTAPPQAGGESSE